MARWIGPETAIPGEALELNDVQRAACRQIDDAETQQAALRHVHHLVLMVDLVQDVVVERDDAAFGGPPGAKVEVYGPEAVRTATSSSSGAAYEG